MSAPLATGLELPAFSKIEAANVQAAVQNLLDEQRARLAALLESGANRWDTLIVPIEEMAHRMASLWAPIRHLNTVLTSDDLRAACNAILSMLAAWQAELSLDERLYRAYEKIMERDGTQLNGGQRQLLSNALRDFRLGGVALCAQDKQRFKELTATLAALKAQFDENVFDASAAWSYHVTEAQRLQGLPPNLVDYAQRTAQARGQPGWVFTLDGATFMAVLSYAHDESLRRQLYAGWVTRASDQGVQPERWDNTSLMVKILMLRNELAQLLGYENYAEYSLATKMAPSVTEVRTFLEELVAATKPVAQREYRELAQLAGRELRPWDLFFYAEQLRSQRLNLSEESLRAYFPLPRVLAGMFKLVERLYSVHIRLRTDVEVYHPDVQFYEVLDSDGSPRGGMFVDLYARDNKRGGAWVDECIGRKRLGLAVTHPVIFLVCNFIPGDQAVPAQLTHSEVVELFHEFGHGLHQLLTTVDYPSIAGTNAVAWDAVELPSQFMENFAWHAEVLPLISANPITGEPLPEQQLQQLHGSRTFHAGMQTLRQLELALFDLRAHSELGEASGAAGIMQLVKEIRRQVVVVQPPDFNRLAHSFQHIFSGGYAAGYYSYKWAEVLSADAFSAFAESARLDETIAQRFRRTILESGGSRDPMDAFVEFRGRRPSIEPLLRQLGLAA